MDYSVKVVVQLDGTDGVTIKRQIDSSIFIRDDVPCLTNAELVKMALEGALQKIPDEPVHKTLDKFDGDKTPESSGETLADKLGKEKVSTGGRKGAKAKKDDVKTIDITDAANDLPIGGERNPPPTGKKLLPAPKEKDESEPPKKTRKKSGGRTGDDEVPPT